MDTKKKRYHINNRKGVTAITFALALTVIMMFAALTTDIGSNTIHKAKLVNALDSAALAGAQELIRDKTNVNTMVKDYLTDNAMDIASPDIVVDDSLKTVKVSGSIVRDYYFARVFGYTHATLYGSSTARVENISSITGARPLAVVHQVFNYGELYTLKEGAGDGTSGNYAAIALGSSGASTYRDNLLNGYDGTITVGDKILTETGNIAGTTETCINHLIDSCPHSPHCTYESYVKTCPRIMFLPVVNTLTINGKKYVEVLGFATFFLEGVTNHGGQADVTGRFITYCMEGQTSTSINDYGTYGIKLIK